jgi:hypothetical protein
VSSSAAGRGSRFKEDFWIPDFGLKASSRMTTL